MWARAAVGFEQAVRFKVCVGCPRIVDVWLEGKSFVLLRRSPEGSHAVLNFEMCSPSMRRNL